jgi:hypothetical protein
LGGATVSAAGIVILPRTAVGRRASGLVSPSASKPTRITFVAHVVQPATWLEMELSLAENVPSAYARS